MIVISDSNIIYSCFYTPNGVIANILKNKKNKVQYIALDYLLEEIKEHLPSIMRDTNRTKQQALNFLKEITKNITFYSKRDILSKYNKEAEKIAADIDIDDVPFIALHLQEGHKIWTCDKILSNRLKEKGYNICITTAELKKKLYIK